VWWEGGRERHHLPEHSWLRWLWPAATRSPCEMTSSSSTHRASTKWNRPMYDGGETSNPWSIPCNPIPWSKRAIITGLVSCMNSQCDFVGASPSQRTRSGLETGAYLAAACLSSLAKVCSAKGAYTQAAGEVLWCTMLLPQK